MNQKDNNGKETLLEIIKKLLQTDFDLKEIQRSVGDLHVLTSVDALIRGIAIPSGGHDMPFLVTILPMIRCWYLFVICVTVVSSDIE
jgi:hypothetical protein